MKKIWITGASSGIGKALALKFAKEGWIVAISARRENLLNEISESNENIHSFPLDVTDKQKCNNTFQEIINKFEAKRPPSLDLFLEYIGISEAEFYSIATGHQVSPWEFDKEEIKAPAGEVDQYCLIRRAACPFPP